MHMTRVTEKRLKKAVLHKTYPSGEEVILDNAYRSQSSTNPFGAMKFMALGEQQFLARQDKDVYDDLLRQQGKAGRKAATDMITRLLTAMQQKAFNTWSNKTQWNRAIRTTFGRFDRDRYRSCHGKFASYFLQESYTCALIYWLFSFHLESTYPISGSLRIFCEHECV
jgi:hypothetical protein